ncbi:MAG: peptidoglycan D,D-transpeptidase FtsI family protein [Microcoleaceae cyanobacterium]
MTNWKDLSKRAESPRSSELDSEFQALRQKFQRYRSARSNSSPTPFSAEPIVPQLTPLKRSNRSIASQKPTASRAGFLSNFPGRDRPAVSEPRPTLSRTCDHRRLKLIWLVLVAGTLGLLANLFRLQVLMGPTLKQQASFQQSRRVQPFVPRRPISDANGHLLALDQLAYTLYAHPDLFKQPAVEIASRLAPLLVQEDFTYLSAKELLEKFKQADSGIKVAETLPQEVANRITRLGIDGIELIQHRQRMYPQEGVAADIIGYVDQDGQGQAGVEYSQQNMLERTMPSLNFQRALDGTWVPSQLASGYVQLDDLELRLTVDTRLQRITQSVLEKHVRKHQAKRGAVIVMDAEDGALLSLVAYPSYNPNRYYESEIERFKNWALSDLYEPGSTFKPVNVALALEAGAIQPDTTVYDEGQIQMGKWTIQNADYKSVGPRGTLNIRDVLKYSSNIGMVRIIQQMEASVYYEGLKRLGVGEIMGLDLPFEVPSTLKSRGQFVNVPVEAATASFGQGLSLTPLKLVQLNAVLANGGKLVKPHVVEGLYDSKGKLYWQLSLPEPKQVFSSQTTNTVLEMMESAVEDGTGDRAKIPGYRVAGKTGTAQKVVDSSGYSKYARITSFVGILSVDNPRYVVLAVIDEPESGSGGTVAAPVVRQVMEGLIGIKHIPPYDLENIQPILSEDEEAEAD